MSKLINIIPNSNFENFEYDNTVEKPDAIKIKDWYYSDENQINSLNSYNGSYSMYLETSSLDIGYTLSANIGVYNPQHKYYFRVYYKDYSVENDVLKVTLADGWPFKSFTIVTKNNDWTSHSEIIDPIPSVTELYDDRPMIWFTHSLNNSEKRIAIDSVMLVDLTETFGEGYEPSRNWCDKNIPYFETEYDLESLPKEIEFTCKESFVFDENTKKYYSNTYSPKITFIVRNVDKEYIEDINVNSQDKIKFSYKFMNFGYSWFDVDISNDNLDISYINNDAYVTVKNLTFTKNMHRAKLQIFSDLSRGYRVKDEMTIYFVGEYNNFDYNLDYDLSYSSTYLRKLKGTTNAYNDVPTSIDVFINGVKTSPVDILNQDDNLTYFEKDLYLTDGNNVISVVATDICGNVKEKSTEIYVDCMTPMPEKEELLKNFIADDSLKTSLHLGNADLKYETSSAGLNKEILIDTSINSHYFKLTGENANLYRLSKDDIPKIQGDIIKRPLGITFDYVEKTYDGTNDITQEVKKLQLDDGYYLNDIHNEYNDFMNTSLVRGTTERKTNETIIYKQFDIITGTIDLAFDDNWNTFDKLISNLKNYGVLNSEDSIEAINENNNYFEKLVNQFKIIFEENDITGLFEYDLTKNKNYDSNNAQDVLRYIMDSNYKNFLTSIYIPSLNFYNTTAKFITHSEYIEYKDFVMNFEGIELLPLLDESIDNEIMSAELIGETIECKSISNSKYKKLESGQIEKTDEGLFYSKFEIGKSADNTKRYIFKAIDTRGCFESNNHPIIAEFSTKDLAVEWLKAYKHAIKSIILNRNSEGVTSILFNFITGISEYTIQSNVIIKYNYKTKNSDLDRFVFKTSDKDLIQIIFSNAFFKSKDVTDEIQTITLNDIEFTKTELGDASNNYQIANYTSTGRILKRTINPHITCLDKVYDGSPIIPFEMSKDFYNGLENSIFGDDIYVDTTFEGDRLDDFHKFTKNGNTIAVADNENVGTNKTVYIDSVILEGHDAKNYKIGNIVSNYKASISKRPISVTINKLRFIRATRKWEIDYSILNDIKEDKLNILYNTNDSNDIKVFGGIDVNGDSIHESYRQLDIIPLFFNYEFNTNYQFKKEDIEVKKISDNSSMAYWNDDALPAEPDTERIDISIEPSNAYPGGIKLSMKSLPNGVKTSYFESKNKEYKLYSGCKVMVTNINLDSSNTKSENYTLLNSTCETEIEII